MQFTLPELHTCKECLPTDINISYETFHATLHRLIKSDATQYVIANVSHVGNATQFLQITCVTTLYKVLTNAE